MDTIRYITDDLSDVDTQELLKCLPNYFEPLGEGPKGVAFLNWRIDKHIRKNHLVTLLVNQRAVLYWNDCDTICP